MLTDNAKNTTTQKMKTQQIDQQSNTNRSKMTDLNEQITEQSMLGMSDANVPRRVSKRKTSKLRD